MSTVTDEMRNEVKLRRLADLKRAVEQLNGDEPRKGLALLQIMGGPSIDPSDYSSQETLTQLSRRLNSYPRSGGIT